MSKTNKVMLIGNLGDDIKIHHFEGGNCIGRLPLATTETYTKKETGEKVSNVEWHNVVFRNKGAELIEKYTSKGDKIFVEGRIKYRKWQGEDGKDNYTTEIHASDFEFLTTKKTGNPEDMDPAQKLRQTPSQPPIDGVKADDDLPF